MPARSLAAAMLVALAALLPGPVRAEDGTAPHEQGWSLTLGAWGAVTKYDVLGLKHVGVALGAGLEL